MWRHGCLVTGGDGQPSGLSALLVKAIKYRGGRVRAVVPDLSTAVEQGFTDPAFGLRGWLALSAPSATPAPIVQKMSDLWVAAADSEPGRRMMESFGLNEKPLNHEEVTKDYAVLKSVLIPLVLALGIAPE